jgi:hypothetical protein
MLHQAYHLAAAALPFHHALYDYVLLPIQQLLLLHVQKWQQNHVLFLHALYDYVLLQIQQLLLHVQKGQQVYDLAATALPFHHDEHDAISL